MTDPQVIVNLGTAGSNLNGQNGSTTGADSNDARFLDWTGDNAGNYVYLPGVAGNYLSVPDEAALQITGDIDLRAYVAMDSWTPAANSSVFGKWRTGGSRSYEMRVLPTGLLQFRWTVDGTTALASSSTAATDLADYSAKWIRATIDVDNGASGRNVTFYLSDDGVTWTQLGTTVTTATETSIFSGDAVVEIGSVGSGAQTVGTLKVYRVQIFDGIDGTKVLDVDTSVLTSGAATSFVALTGQTVTINRSTSGRKSVAVVSPVWLFGTDDYMEVADNDLLDFDADQSFSTVIVIRWWDDPISAGRIFSKQGSDSELGYSMRQSGATGAFQVRVAMNDGTNSQAQVKTYGATGDLVTYSMVVDRSTDTLTVYGDTAAETPVSVSSVGSVASSLPLRIGRRGDGTDYQDFELLAIAVFRRALTATEITAITAYYQARLS